MSDKMRWRYGDTNPVVAAVDSASVIEIGDLLYLDTDDAKPASAMSDLGTDAQNQEGFCNKFLGVAMQRSKSGETTPIRVATKGVFEFDCPSGTFEIGDYVAPDGNADASALLDQQVEKVGVFDAGAIVAKRAIGKVAKRVSAAATTVLVDIRSTVMYGGVEAGSYSA